MFLLRFTLTLAALALAALDFTPAGAALAFAVGAAPVLPSYTFPNIARAGDCGNVLVIRGASVEEWPAHVFADISIGDVVRYAPSGSEQPSLHMVEAYYPYDVSHIEDEDEFNPDDPETGGVLFGDKGAVFLSVFYSGDTEEKRGERYALGSTRLPMPVVTRYHRKGYGGERGSVALIKHPAHCACEICESDAPEQPFYRVESYDVEGCDILACSPSGCGATAEDAIAVYRKTIEDDAVFHNEEPPEVMVPNM